MLEEIAQISHQKIDSIAPIRNPANTASYPKRTDSHDYASSASSVKSDREWEADPKFIIGGILVGAGVGVCVSALTVGIVFSAPAVATVTAGLALGGLAGYAVGTIVKNANAESIVSTEPEKIL